MYNILGKLLYANMNKIISEDIKNILKENLPWEKLVGKTVLISGASGFIPSYIVNTLLAIENVKVIGIVRNIKKANLKFSHCINNKNLKIIEQNISESFNINDKIDYIIHAASQASPKYYGIDPVGTLKANTIGTNNLLEIAVEQNIEKFLYFSSCEIYGPLNENSGLITENYNGCFNTLDVRSCYSESKRMGENMCICYSHQYNIPVNIIRLSHTYGPEVQLDDGRVFGDFAKNILNKENIILNSDGSAKRSFCYISDMIRALFYVLFLGKDKNAYNIASSKETSILEFARLFIDLYPELNLKIKFSNEEYKKGYLKSPSCRANIDTTKIKSLGWNEQVELKDGLKRMIESYL